MTHLTSESCSGILHGNNGRIWQVWLGSASISEDTGASFGGMSCTLVSVPELNHEPLSIGQTALMVSSGGCSQWEGLCHLWSMAVPMHVAGSKSCQTQQLKPREAYANESFIQFPELTQCFTSCCVV